MSGTDAQPKIDKPSGKTSRWMVVALLVAAIVFVFKIIAPQTVGEQVRRQVEQKFRDHYPHLDISIGRGHYDPKTGLIFSDIRVAVPTGQDSADESELAEQSLARRFGLASYQSRELMRIDQVVVVANASFQRLLEKKNPLVTERIMVKGMKTGVWFAKDGTVSLQQLWPLPKFGEVTCPRIELRDAKFTLFGDSQTGRPLEVELDEAVVLKNPPAPETLAETSLPNSIPVNHSTTQPAASGTPANSTRSSSDTTNHVARLPEQNEPSCVTTLTGRGSASFADRFAFHVTNDSGIIDIRGELNGGKISDELVARLPEAMKGDLQQLTGLEVLADTNIVARIEKGRPPRFATRSKVHDGRFRHPKSPMPLKQIRGILSCDDSGVQFESFQANWGDALIKVDGSVVGYTQPLEAHLDVSATNLMLDQRFAAVLPKRLEAGWKKFEPRGLIDVPRAHFDILGTQITSDADVTCKGVDLVYDKFPYPVRQVTGALTVANDRIKSDLIAGRIGGQLMQCLFDVPMKSESNQPRVFSLAMDGPIAIDSELLHALSPRGSEETKLETFVRSLNPLGAVHLVRGTMRTDQDGIKHQDLELKVSDGSLRFDQFPYPLYNVVGDIHVVDSMVTLSGFQGSNANGGLIECEGDYQIPPKPGDAVALPKTLGSSLVLDFSAKRIALDESLRRSLPSSSQLVWDALAPSGVLDSMEITLTRDTATSKIDLEIAGQQFDANGIGSDTLRLQPTALPYRLDIREGAVRFNNGQIYIDSILAEHGGSIVSADGSCRQLPGGRWLLSVNVHNGSRVVADSELVSALPEQMRGAMRGLNLRGPVGISGLTETLLANEVFPDPVFGWDLLLQLEGNRIGEVGPVHGLRGELSIKGRRDSAGLAADGDVRIDSLHINELQLTRLRGPFQIRDDRLRLGGYGSDAAFQQPIEGRLFDGTLRMDGNVRLSDASFNVRLALIGAKLPVLLAELGHGQHELAGDLVGSVKLEGLLGTREILRGSGHASVENANLYQVPVLMQLLNVLSITPTEDAAFTNGDVVFRISEDELLFDDVKLWGSLIALHGSGTLDRRRELELTFNTRVSPRNTFTRILRPIMDQRYTLWTVDVTGPLDDLSIRRRALEGVGQTIELLFPGMNNGAEAKRKDRSAGIGRMLQ